MNSIAIVNPNILNPDNKLYSLLSSDNAPIWWNLLKQDPELYIEIHCCPLKNQNSSLKLL